MNARIFVSQFAYVAAPCCIRLQTVSTELQCHKGELPDLDTLDQYTGIFVTGSHCSANEAVPWIQSEATWLYAFAQRQTACKLVASCFGCQV